MNIKNAIALSAWAVVLLLMAFPILGMKTEDGGNWPQFHRDAAHNGSNNIAAPGSNQTAWISEKIGAQEGSSVAVSEGRVFVNCVDHLVCLDLQSGKLLWKTSDDDGIGEWRCSPALADGLLFLGKTEDMNYRALYALNSSTGETVWSYPAGGSSPAVAAGMVFTIGEGRVYALGRGGQA